MAEAERLFLLDGTALAYRSFFAFIRNPMFDRKGRISHTGGVVDAPGLYLLGMPFLRTRKSSFIDGAADDARFLSAHLSAYLETTPSRRLRVV